MKMNRMKKKWDDEKKREQPNKNKTNEKTELIECLVGNMNAYRM